MKSNFQGKTLLHKQYCQLLPTFLLPKMYQSHSIAWHRVDRNLPAFDDIWFTQVSINGAKGWRSVNSGVDSRLMRLTSTCSLPKVFKPTCRLKAFCIHSWHVSILMLSRLVSRAWGSRLSSLSGWRCQASEKSYSKLIWKGMVATKTLDMLPLALGL